MKTLMRAVRAKFNLRFGHGCNGIPQFPWAHYAEL